MDERVTNPSTIVIIGSSSGGIDALAQLVGTLPEDFPAPVIVAQHLDPTHASQLVGILSRYSSLPVQPVTHHIMLQPGEIYVIPPNHDVVFSDQEIRVTEPGTTRPMPSIDRLMSTAAESYGSKLIAVILTGTGSDGTAGARDVKAADGTVIIQDPSTAEYSGMPRSLAPTSVDFVRELSEIGPLLSQLVVDPASIVDQAPPQATSLDEFLRHVQRQSNIDFSQYKTNTILRRLNRRLVATGTRTLSEYMTYLGQDPQEYHQLINSFLIKVTEFFRDQELFDALRTRVLPDLIDQARSHGYRLRIWSAGCATGEEAYSLAILIAELLGREREQFEVRIFATDVDPNAVAFARQGIYPSSALSELPEDLVRRHFISHNGEYEISKEVRSLVIFGEHDLAQRSPFPRTDLILCRNVLMYFTPELQRRALQIFAFSLRVGGYLALGKSESANALGEHFELDDRRLRTFRRSAEQAYLPSMDSKAGTATAPLDTASVDWQPTSSYMRGTRRTEHRRSTALSEDDKHLLFHLPVGIVVVDRNYDVRLINNAARRLLGVHGTATGQDLLHLIRTIPLEPLRDRIDQAFRTRDPVGNDFEWKVELADGEQLYLDIQCYPREISDDGEAHLDGAVIVMTDITRVTVEQGRTSTQLNELQHETEHLRARLDRMSRENRQLLDDNHELASINEELQSANEQLRIRNEESQAAAEEIETLNEELQASNEELETLNEELQATVEELNATNQDMQARTGELQEMAVSLEEQRQTSDTERARLEAILVSMGDAVLVVDTDGEILLMNDAFKRLFGEDLSGLKPENESGDPIPESDHPHVAARRGEPFTMQFTVTDENGDRYWFDAIGRPIEGTFEHDGTVVVIRDITDRSLRRLQEQFMSLASHELRTPLTALRGYLEMLEHRLTAEGGDERALRYTSVALKMVKRLVILVGDLLDVGRLQSGKFALAREEVDLRDLTEQTIDLAQTLTHGQTIHLHAEEQSLVLFADPIRLQQVVLNLLTNAINYSDSSDRIDVRLRTRNENAEIEVQDYGTGISREHLPNIFTRYFQVDPPEEGRQRGLGLGLSIAEEIARAHGGDIDVDSTPDEGTTFTVRIPMARRDAE